MERLKKRGVDMWIKEKMGFCSRVLPLNVQDNLLTSE